MLLRKHNVNFYLTHRNKVSSICHVTFNLYVFRGFGSHHKVDINMRFVWNPCLLKYHITSHVEIIGLFIYVYKVINGVIWTCLYISIFFVHVCVKPLLLISIVLRRKGTVWVFDPHNISRCGYVIVLPGLPRSCFEIKYSTLSRTEVFVPEHSDWLPLLEV